MWIFEKFFFDAHIKSILSINEHIFFFILHFPLSFTSEMSTIWLFKGNNLEEFASLNKTDSKKKRKTKKKRNIWKLYLKLIFDINKCF